MPPCCARWQNVPPGRAVKRAETERASSRLEAGSRIDIELVDGPFKSLAGHWRFTPLGEAGCKVELDLDFELASGLLRRLLGPIFSEITNKMVDAFCRRAREVYGDASNA